jgi:hypothetical protein
VPMLKRRSRIVSFRCSPEEYDSLKSLSLSNGARSVSEFTRSVAVQSDSLSNLNEVIDKLDKKVQRLTEILEKHDE